MARYKVLKRLYSKSAGDYIEPGDIYEIDEEGNEALIERLIKNGRMVPAEIKRRPRRKTQNQEVTDGTND